MKTYWGVHAVSALRALHLLAYLRGVRKKASSLRKYAPIGERKYSTVPLPTIRSVGQHQTVPFEKYILDYICLHLQVVDKIRLSFS